MNGVQTRFKCKLDVKRCKRFVFPPSSLLPRSNALKTKAIRYFQTDRTLTRIVSPPLFQGNDFPLARWADVLLMMAEAEVRKSNAAPSAEAVSAVNEVRNRAGLNNLSTQQTNSKETFLDAILEERAKEFLYEGQRKIDLIRFNKYAQLCRKTKGVLPTHQYVPLPNYFVEQAKSYGKNLQQTYSRPGWSEDLSKATN